MKLETKQKLILTAILASSVGMTGCSQPSNDATTSNTTTNVVSAISPTGTIQGVLIDAVTQQPIVGALIDIGLASAVTNQDGQFVLANVPATQIGTGAAQGTTLTGNYEVSINLKNVVYPAGVTTKYPDFSFKQAQVEYTSDVNSPLTGIVKGYQFTVGKLAATIAGVVTDATGKPAPAGYNVTLYSALNAQNSATGGTGQGPVVVAGSNSGHIVSTTTTNASGNFTFANIEAGVAVMIAAQDTASTQYGERAITAPTENATRTLSFQNGDAVVVKSTDVTAPVVASVTPENFSDITPAATSVIFTFNEPIKQTSVVADVSPSNPNGLYSKVNVNFTGPKPLASNLSHSLAWNATGTQLTVTIPILGASSMYTVDISPAVTAGMIADSAGNAMAAPVAPLTTTTAMQTVNFTTNGGATAAAPTIAMTNSASINATSTLGAPVAATLNWLPTSGAKGYNVYRTMKEVWPTSTVVHPTVKLNATALFVTTYTDPFTDPTLVPSALDYVEFGAVKQTYDYVVKAVNSDGSESAASGTVTAADVMAPALVAAAPTKAVVCGSAVTCDPITGKVKDITIAFDEQMDQATAANPANYASTQLGAFSSAAYTPATVAVVAPATTWSITAPATVKLTLTTPVTPLPVNAVPFGYITTGANGVNNSTVAAGDTTVIALGAGAPNAAVCVRAGAIGANPAVAPAIDDVLVAFTATTAGYIHSGPNGVCNTTATPAPATDVQVSPVGQGAPNTVAVNPGATGILVTGFVANSACVTAAAVGATAMTEALVGDDRFVMGTVATNSVINSGANGICETTATGTDVQTLTVGRLRPTTPGVSDDELVPAAAVVTVTGVKDVAGNAIAGKTKYNADGTVN